MVVENVMQYPKKLSRNDTGYSAYFSNAASEQHDKSYIKSQI